MQDTEMDWLFGWIVSEKTEEKAEAAQWSLVSTDMTPMVAMKLNCNQNVMKQGPRDLTILCLLPFRFPTSVS